MFLENMIYYYILIFGIIFIIFYYRNFSYKALINAKIIDINEDDKNKILNLLKAQYQEINFNELIFKDIFKYKVFGCKQYIIYFSKENTDYYQIVFHYINKHIKVLTINSYFKNEISLTTGNNTDIGNIPFLKNYYLQIFKNENINFLIDKHLNGVYLLNKKLNTNILKLDRDELRKYFLETQIKFYNIVGSFQFFKMIFYKIRKVHKKYLGDLNKQTDII
jgi:hypothetical protein